MSNQTCSLCKLSVAGTKTLSYSGKTIHDTCFYCFNCKNNLNGKQFSEKNDKVSKSFSSPLLSQRGISS